jgi:integrase
MPRLTNQNPSYRKHRASGQAVVTICGHDHYLGPWRSRASLSEYDRLVGEWLAAGRRLPASAMPDLAVAELADRYLEFAKGYFVFPDGSPNSHVGHFKACLKFLVKLYADAPVSAFGPLALDVVRNAMVAEGWSRTYINSQVIKLKRVFRWGVAQQLVSSDVYAALEAVEGLRRGKSKAFETEPVTPVDHDVVDATLPHLGSIVRAMIETQLLSGCRPGEICGMRVGEIDRSGNVWKYVPASHKNTHRGQQRNIFLGPKAQLILAPFMRKIDPLAHVFSPKDSVAEMRHRRSENRKTPISCGNVAGSNQVRRPKREAKDIYDVNSYRRAITRACDKADLWAKGGVVIANDERIVPCWNPGQLRHTAATNLRRTYGLEGAQTVLGHASLQATQIYAEKNNEIARQIAAKIG